MAETSSDNPPPYNLSAPNEAPPNEAGIQNQNSDSQPTTAPYPAPAPAQAQAPVPQAEALPAYPPQYLPQGAYPPHSQQFGSDQPPPQKYQDMTPYNAQQQYPAQFPAYGATTVTQQPARTITVVNIFSDQPADLQCPNCQQMVTTEVSHKAGTLAWLVCLSMFMVGFFLLIPWFICWLPFCIDSAKDIVHTCPRCRHVLGHTKRM
ncbi:lipopolysaccharide-induced tumor necrosis factor-alpha factor homolog [Amphiura filiformis]|uniref:lipopolysaccharide-induced tumor necrosis factor-alpha factor homolog n=1 Tax=Amphiura filiformis TaxID=82378 RepID=UPI003B2243D0